MLPALRFVRWTVLGSVLVAIVVSVVLAGQSASSPLSFSAMFGGDMADTPWGPLSPADRDMLIKVRQADLWAGTVGEQAAARSTNPAVKDAARKLAVEHAQLEVDLKADASKLGVRLPDQPSDMQNVWMGMISGATPTSYDKTFVNLVRSAHGEVLPLVEGVRAGTENQLVRQLAIEASGCLGQTMAALEATGLVDYALFPPTTAPAARLTAMGGYTVPITLVLFLIAVVVSAALLRGMSRPRPGVVGRRERFAWAARVSALLGRTGRRGGAAAIRRGAQSDERQVTTAELLAVLNPNGASGTGAFRPILAQPRTGQPGGEQPGQPRAGEPGAGQRGGPARAGHPGAGQPGTGQPGGRRGGPSVPGTGGTDRGVGRPQPVAAVPPSPVPPGTVPPAGASRVSPVDTAGHPGTGPGPRPPRQVGPSSLTGTTHPGTTHPGTAHTGTELRGTSDSPWAPTAGVTASAALADAGTGAVPVSALSTAAVRAVPAGVAAAVPTGSIPEQRAEPSLGAERGEPTHFEPTLGPLPAGLGTPWAAESAARLGVDYPSRSGRGRVRW